MKKEKVMKEYIAQLTVTLKTNIKLFWTRSISMRMTIQNKLMN